MRSQEDMFISLVTKRVLNREVSDILISASSALHQDESILFQQAVSNMTAKDIAFWVSPSDSQFWLDEDRYAKYVVLKKELNVLETAVKERAIELE